MAQTITVDITPGFRMPTLFYSQGDIGTTFAVDLRSRFGDTLPASPTITIGATKPSGFGFSVEADSITDGVATFTTTEGMTDEAGRFPAELQIVKDDVTFYTAKFFMEGAPRAHPDGTTDGQAEQAIPIITLLVERAEAAAESIHELNVAATTLNADAAATATYDDETNTITFGIPKGKDGYTTANTFYFTDPDADGNVIITVG